MTHMYTALNLSTFTSSLPQTSLTIKEDKNLCILIEEYF